MASFSGGISSALSGGLRLAAIIQWSLVAPGILLGVLYNNRSIRRLDNKVGDSAGQLSREVDDLCSALSKRIDDSNRRQDVLLDDLIRRQQARHDDLKGK
jgi:hypothetical protein